MYRPAKWEVVLDAILFVHAGNLFMKMYKEIYGSATYKSIYEF